MSRDSQEVSDFSVCDWNRIQAEDGWTCQNISTRSSISQQCGNHQLMGIPFQDVCLETETAGFPEIRIQEAQKMKLNKLTDYRILPIIWLCYFWDRQLETVFTQQNIPDENATALDNSLQRREVDSAVLAFYMGRAIGVWLGSMAIMVEEFARVVPTSIFLTGIFASLLNFYSKQNTVLRPVCYALCALSSSPLMPASMLLAHVCYSKRAQLTLSVLWATAGPIAVFIGEINHVANNWTNLPVTVEGIIIGVLSLAIEPWISSSHCTTAPWILSQRAVMVFDVEEHPNNWTRFRALWKLYKNQVSGSLVDYQLYFFLLFAIADASIKREMSGLLEWKFADAFAQASPLLAYAIVGTVLHFSTRVGCVAIPMAVVTFMEMCGWWPLQNCEKVVYGYDGPQKCRPTPLWLLSLVPAAGEISITLAIILLLTNTSGKVRSVFLVAVFCSEHAIGGLMCTVLTSRLTIDQWHKFVLIASMIKIVCLWIYVNFTAVQNLKRRKQINMAGGEYTCAWLEGASEETEKMDIENDHFVYVY